MEIAYLVIVCVLERDACTVITQNLCIACVVPASCVPNGFLDLVVSFFLTLAIAAVVKIMPDGEGQFPGSYLRINHTHASAEVKRTSPS